MLPLEQAVRDHMASLTPLKEIADSIDAETTTIATYADLLSEAVDYYKIRLMNDSSLPDFLIIDWDGTYSELYKEYEKLYSIQIYPISHIQKIRKKDLCIYARPQQVLAYIKYGFSKIAMALRFYGIEQCTIDRHVFPPLQVIPGYSTDLFMAEICAVYAALSDEESKDTFLRVLKARELRDPLYLPIAPYKQYWHPMVSPLPGDIIIEGGLLNGGSTADFIENARPKAIYAFEPVEEFAQRCREKLSIFPNVVVEQLGLWSCATDFYIENNGASSRMHEQPSVKGELCHCIAIDDYLKKQNSPCDFIKLDIEGAEVECLKGAMRTLHSYTPKLQVAVYHYPGTHFFDIPLMLMKEKLQYEFYMGHHTGLFYDTILYTVKSNTQYRASQLYEITNSFSEQLSCMQQTALAHILDAAKKLYGKKVVFFGAGYAYQHYKMHFKGCNPQGMIMGRNFIPNAEHPEVDGIPIVFPDHVPRHFKELPLIIFVRREHAHHMLHNARHTLGWPEDLITLCILTAR